jgi:TPR repeat protein
MNRTNLVSAVAVVIALVSTTQAQTSQPKPIDRLRVTAARGDAQAMFDLGLAYQTGKEIPQDRGEAAAWFRKAAAAGNADAAYRLG